MTTLFRSALPAILGLTLLVLAGSCRHTPPLETLHARETLVLLGNNLPARMMQYGYFETAVQAAFPDSLIRIRNMGDGGNTPGFRPHSGRNHSWAFPEAEALLSALYPPSGNEGHLETPDQWLTRLDADLILAFFGFNEVFRPQEYQDITAAELAAFVAHTRAQHYHGNAQPRLVLLSPTAMESGVPGPELPGFDETNAKLEAYTRMMERVADSMGVPFLDLYHPSLEWHAAAGPNTIDGLQLNDAGNRKLAAYLAERLFGINPPAADAPGVLAAVREKNWFWQNDFKIPNGVHVFGRRYDPFGPDNYPYELEKIRQMTAVRDTAIWAVARGDTYEVEAADARTRPLPPVVSNYQPQSYGHGGSYLYGEDALASFTLAPGYQIELFASERDFPELANPVQLSFDDRGRLWVATMPSYPHYKPGDPIPNDKLLILEDTNRDGRADTVKVWADSLHLPVGFELSPEGVYVSQGSHLKRLSDTDGDDRADRVEILLSGFDDHDTHHAISAFTADPSGAIYMGEGTFLHTNVETPYGPVRGTQGGFYRYNPRRQHLERTAQLPIPNPWGIAFDRWGQPFFLDTSGPALRWMSPGSLKPVYGTSDPLPRDLVPEAQKVRPTAGLEFVSSRHFPSEDQGDVLLCNSIGFLGIKQHQVLEDGTGYRLEFRQDLLQSSDRNFRPVDLEFAPDGSLYVVDWHNMLVGHMQHNARDPYRDHSHGRIYRITRTDRPTLEPAQIADAPVDRLLELLKAPEYRTRYRARRALRGFSAESVMPRLLEWLQDLDPKDPAAEHHRLEALWVSWGLNRVDRDLLATLLGSSDHRVRAAAVRAIRYNLHQLDDGFDLLQTAAADTHGRVRLEVLATASWLPEAQAQPLLNRLAQAGVDDWMNPPYLAVQHRLSGQPALEEKTKPAVPDQLKGTDSTRYLAGREIYHRDGYCATCHQADGKGLPASGFPPLSGSEWVTADTERLIQVTLKGLQGPITVAGQNYDGQVPMTAFENLLTDAEIAAVLTYVRNAFGNAAGAVSPEEVQAIRDREKDQKTFYLGPELNR
ncbi:GDSL-type esterase/lipase family protein [Robiginitalea sp. M366]|uniref:PVC-type heme-binding CxxCH protein n=1 Tax=Robiginitalea aestuariiviva TaxID=3036903 RepID=UPI00240E610D|nr:PVC-type heme-binding CxxCH protein [Robiginitalea aestuariiviva]MDG1570838.1 GDSL-type esterase/lipase family protein [Robiginitalea aestuariiviva]